MRGHFLHEIPGSSDELVHLFNGVPDAGVDTQRKSEWRRREGIGIAIGDQALGKRRRLRIGCTGKSIGPDAAAGDAKRIFEQQTIAEQPVEDGIAALRAGGERVEADDGGLQRRIDGRLQQRIVAKLGCDTLAQIVGEVVGPCGS